MFILSKQHRLVAIISFWVVLQQKLAANAFQCQALATKSSFFPQNRSMKCARQSPLWSAASSKHNDLNNNENRPRKRDKIQSVLLQQKKTVLNTLQTLLAKLNIHVETTYLSKRMGSFLVMTALLLGLWLGQPSTVVPKALPSPVTTVVAKKPIAPTPTKATEIPYSQFMDHCVRFRRSTILPMLGSTQQQISRVQLEPGGTKISFWFQGSLHYTRLLEGTTTDHLVQFLHEHRIPFQAATSPRLGGSTGDWSTLLVTGGMGYYLYQQGAFQSLLSSTTKKQRSKQAFKNTTPKTTTFDDIEGVNSAKEAVLELVDSLRNPEKYRLVGARPPTGLLLEGPPGTGKVRT